MFSASDVNSNLSGSHDDSYRLLSPALALGAAGFALVALPVDTWSTSTISAPPIGPPVARAPPSMLIFGLTSFRAYLFGARKPAVTPYSHLQQTSEVQGLRTAGLCIEIACWLEAASSVLLVGALVAPTAWSTAVVGGVRRWLLRASFAWIAAIAGVAGVVLWAIVASEASGRLRSASRRVLLPAATVSVRLGASFVLATLAAIAACTAAAIETARARRAKRDEEESLVGAVLPGYDTYDSRAPLAL